MSIESRRAQTERLAGKGIFNRWDKKGIRYYVADWIEAEAAEAFEEENGLYVSASSTYICDETQKFVFDSRMIVGCGEPINDEQLSNYRAHLMSAIKRANAKS